MTEWFSRSVILDVRMGARIYFFPPLQRSCISYRTVATLYKFVNFPGVWGTRSGLWLPPVMAYWHRYPYPYSYRYGLSWCLLLQDDTAA